MSNILSFADALKKREDSQRLTTLEEAGLDRTTLTIATLAANCAFNNRSDLPTLEEASSMGFDTLKYLSITTHANEEDTQVVTFLYDQVPVLHYLSADGNFTDDWHEAGSIGVSLADDEHAPETVMTHLLGWTRELDTNRVSNYGFFALMFFHIAAASKLSPIHLQYFPENKMVGMVLYDRLRDTDVALIANLKNWLPQPEDEQVQA